MPIDDDDTTAAIDLPVACSACGRTDLPMAGDWDPPICTDCDAAINMDARLEGGELHG
jgi:hypothetical protein